MLHNSASIEHRTRPRVRCESITTMTMRISTFIRSTGIALLLLACGILLQSAERNGEVSAATLAVPEASPATVARIPPPYEGPRSLEYRILASPVIVR